MKRNVIISAAAAAVLTVGGPTAAALAATGDTARTTTTATAARADVTAESASDAALKHYPGVVESLDKDGAVWHVNVIAKNGKNAEVEVSTAGKATTRDTDNDNNGNEYAPLIAAKVNAKKAMAAALAANKGAVVWSVDWDDDDDNGSTYWDVEVKAKDGTTKHVHVDPTSGKVTASSSDSNDNDDDNN
ncbi:PepSY domain-containing protein [Streptomyces sp. NPDC048272]|uniref:PepSY domain-containing protein n=1 Tax=Streptomyces sp. NPDC048272 TaxID=3154616 RepID=UPI00343A3A97